MTIIRYGALQQFASARSSLNYSDAVARLSYRRDESVRAAAILESCPPKFGM